MTIEFCYLIFITAGYYTINNFIVQQLLLKKNTKKNANKGNRSYKTVVSQRNSLRHLFH